MIETDPENENRSTPGGVEISVVVPIYEESQSLPELVGQIGLVLQSRTFELILVDDGSRDDTWEVIKKLKSRYSWLKGVSLQRNYGKSTALQTGFNLVKGRYIVTLDADLQDDPNEIPMLLEKLKSGYDLVSGWKKRRKDPWTKTVPSRFFNMVTRWVTGIKIHDFNCGLKVYRKEVIDRIYLYGELHRYVPLLAKWQGYDQIGEKVVNHHPRKYGSTKFGLSRFIHGFLDLITLIFVNNYMSRPMHFFGSFGILALVAGGTINLYLAYLKIVQDAALANRPLLFLGVMLVVIGVQFFSIGFLGDMINKGQVDRRNPNIRDRL